ncbi:MAG: tetratricopeptide repeat protein [Bacteroidales bacterium]|nr:tetratricopeptide repeat protein [Bacteroidales bacterium]MCF8388660.1 tetratricopeptide repeat protein [Bacteroidales bacterium]MCF8397975.1 tetratricopeptide repeat protein [Bacteroidales bacterium]
MRNFSGIIVFFLLGIQTVFAQEPIDMLIKKYKHASEDSSKVLLLNKLALAFSDTNVDISTQYARQGLNLANKINYRYGIALSNRNLAYAFLQGNNFQPAINYYLICIKIYNEIGRFDQSAEAYNKIGEIYKSQGSQRQALDHFNKALQLAEQASSRYHKANALNNIGSIHFDETNYDQAYEYYLKSLMIREEIQDTIGMAASYNNVAEIYRLREEFDKALNLYEISIGMNKILDKQDWLAINYLNIGNVHLASNNYDEAFASFQKALEINQKIGNQKGIANSNIWLGNYYVKIKNPRKALELFRIALEIGRKHNYPRVVSASALGSSEAQSNMRNFDKALKFFKMHSSIDDSLFNVEKARQIAEMEARFEADRQKQELILKDQEIELYERNERIIRLQMIMAIGGLVLFIIIGLLMYGRQKGKIRKDRELMDKNREIHHTQQKLMKSELNIKNNELMNFALHIVQKNDFLQAVKNDLKIIKARCDEKEQPQKINELLLKVNQNLRMSTELEQFQKNVDQVNREFFHKLENKFPNLTENEKRLSALLRLNLSSKEIATLNNISIKAVEMGRYRLRKKILLETNDSLTDFLQKL